jgi:hypothetical protein
MTGGTALGRQRDFEGPFDRRRTAAYTFVYAKKEGRHPCGEQPKSL